MYRNPKTRNLKNYVVKNLPCYSYWFQNDTQCKQKELYTRLKLIRDKKVSMFKKLFGIIDKVNSAVSGNRHYSHLKIYHQHIFKIGNINVEYSRYMSQLKSDARKCLNSDLALKQGTLCVMCSSKANEFVWTKPSDRNVKRFKVNIGICKSYIDDCSPLWTEIKRLSKTFHNRHSFRELRDQLDLISKSISMRHLFWIAIDEVFIQGNRRIDYEGLCDHSMDIQNKMYFYLSKQEYENFIHSGRSLDLLSTDQLKEDQVQVVSSPHSFCEEESNETSENLVIIGSDLF